MVAYALVPARTQQYRDTAACGVISNLLIGLLPTIGIFFGIATALQAGKGPIAALVLAVAGLLLLWSLLGAGGLALLVGERLWPGHQPEHTRQQILRGGALIMGCCFLPIFGWFGLLPALAVTGLGIRVRRWIRKERIPSDHASHNTSSGQEVSES